MLDCIYGAADAGRKPGTDTNSTCSRTMKFACAFFWISAIALTVTALMMHYPNSTSTIFYTTFSIVAFLSLVAMIVTHFRKKNETAIPVPATTASAASTNPFAEPSKA